MYTYIYNHIDTYSKIRPQMHTHYVYNGTRMVRGWYADVREWYADGTRMVRQSGKIANIYGNHGFIVFVAFLVYPHIIRVQSAYNPRTSAYHPRTIRVPLCI